MNVIDQEFDPAIPVEKIHEHPDNPRKGDDKSVGESIAKTGFFGAVLVQRSTGNIIAGNTRYRVMTEEGQTTIPGFWVECDDVTATRILLADNRTSDLAFYDDEGLFLLLKQLVDSDGLEGTGYDRAAYELLLQSVEASEIVGGIRQGMTPDDRIDEYNALDVRSIILPYEAAEYEMVALGFQTLRDVWGLDTNAATAKRLVSEAVAALGTAS
jgi:hypothetical protein